MNIRFALFCIGIFLGTQLMSLQSIGNNSHNQKIEEETEAERALEENRVDHL